MFLDKRFQAAVIDADQTPKQVAGFISSPLDPSVT
jgi:hypothetical protein